MTYQRFTLFAALALLALSACSPKSGPSSEFWKRIEPLCGNAYEGKIVSDDPADEDWRTQRLIIHVRSCAKDEIRIPLHVGDDHGRVWVITRDDSKLEFRHEHHFEDGNVDAISNYGGFNAENSSGSRQNFPSDEISNNLFDELGLPDSKQNIWAIEVRPDAHSFSYEMSRPGRMIRIEFDTSKPIEIPPAPWGTE